MCNFLKLILTNALVIFADSFLLLDNLQNLRLLLAFCINYQVTRDNYFCG